MGADNADRKCNILLHKDSHAQREGKVKHQMRINEVVNSLKVS